MPELMTWQEEAAQQVANDKNYYQFVMGGTIHWAKLVREEGPYQHWHFIIADHTGIIISHHTTVTIAHYPQLINYWDFPNG